MQDFSDKAAANMWYMPLWTLEELLKCLALVYVGPHAPGVALVTELYEHYGGVARYVLEYPWNLGTSLTKLLQPLERAIARSNIDEVGLLVV